MILDDAQGKGHITRIVVGNPKRHATTSIAHHVAAERGESIGQSVGYCIGASTEGSGKMHAHAVNSILYSTEGCLVNLLRKFEFTHIIIDEVHERGLGVDVLLMEVRKLVTVQDNLKVIFMSATVNVDLYRHYFVKPMQPPEGNGLPGVSVKVIELGGGSSRVITYYYDEVG